MKKRQPTETLGERLQRLRQAARLSQPQLAEAAGVPVTTLRNWEQGRRGMMLETAATVAEALGVTLDELAGSDTETQESPRIRSHVNDVEAIISEVKELARLSEGALVYALNRGQLKVIATRLEKALAVLEGGQGETTADSRKNK